MKKIKPEAPAAPAVVQATLDLPYEKIDNSKMVSRDGLREMAAAKEAGYGRQSSYIQHSIIRWRNGFNVRIKPDELTDEQWEEKLEIPQFAMDLLTNGMGSPIEGDLLINEKGEKEFVLTAGERRTRAIGWLIRNGHDTQKNGKPMGLVEVFINGRETTEEERNARMITTDSNLKYNPVELGHAFLRMKTLFGKSHEQISKEYNQSRQTVDNYIKLATEPSSIQNAILMGRLTPTAAIELINTEKDPAKREEIVSAATSSNVKLKIKDIKAADKYKDYHGMFAAIILRFNDKIITYSGALHETNELAEKVTAALPDQKPEIDTVVKNIKEVLNNNAIIQTAEEKTDRAMTTATQSNNNPEITHFEKEEVIKGDVVFLDTPAYGISYDENIEEKTWEEKMNEVVTHYENDRLAYIHAYTGIERIKQEAWRKPGNKEYRDGIAALATKAFARLSEIRDKKVKAEQPVKYEKAAADDEEEKSHITADKEATYRPKSQKDDALTAIDFKKDKELGEMELTEAIGMLDKLEVKIGLFPEHLKQYKDDCVGLAITIRRKVEVAREIIKKASDVR